MVLSGIFLLLDLYLFQGVVAATQGLSPASRSLIHIAWWSLYGLVVLGLLAYNLLDPYRLGPKTRTVLLAGIFAVFMGKLFMLFFMVVDEARRLLGWLWGAISGEAPPTWLDPARSAIVARVGAAAATVPLLATGWGILGGAHDYRVRRETVYLPHLPEAFDGLRLLQLSDIHAGSFWSPAAVQRGVELVMQQEADIVCFTGDLVNNRAEEMEAYQALFAQIKAPLGVYSILGNHDYGDYVAWPSAEAKRANLQRLAAVHRAMGWDLLLNTHRWLERDGARIALLGVENWGAKANFPQYGKLAEAYAGTEDAPVHILLSHDPSHWQAEVRTQFPQIDLTLSGHTHGMQFGVEVPGLAKWSPVQYVYPEWAGLYQEGMQYLYVNRGFGYLGFPGRIGIPPEITVLTLKRGTPPA